MTWTLLTTIAAGQDWQFTPVIAASLGYVRLSFSTAGVPIWIAQADPDATDIYDERRIMATPHPRILEFAAPPFFNDRALALRVPNFTRSFDVSIEVSSMPFISSGGSISITPSIAAVGRVTEVPAATQSTTLLAVNANRKKLIVINNSTAVMYLAFGEVATTTNHTIAISADGDGYELEGFTGIVSALWTAANGQARITEFE